MADLELHVDDTHALITIYLKDQDSAVVDLEDQSTISFVARPKQNDEATVSMTEVKEDEGTGDGNTSGQTLTVAGENFTSTVQVGDLIYVTGETVRTVSEVTSDTVLTHAGTAYDGVSNADWYVSRARVTCKLTAGTLNPGDQECRVHVDWTGGTDSYTTDTFIVKGLT